MKKTEEVFEGNLNAEPGKVYPYKVITGYIYARGVYTKTAFPRLQSVGRHIDARGADTRTAFPRLQSVGGNIFTDGADTRTAFPSLQSVGGNIFTNGADTKTAFPRLQSVGRHINAEGDFPQVKTNDPATFTRCREILSRSFLRCGYSFADGILAKIVSQRGRVARVIICGKTEVTYLVTDGENYSHGETLAKAREGLIYKIGSRDTTEFKGWTLDKEVSKADGIRAYRAITGACEPGVRQWMETRKTPEKITISGIIKLTEGAYGHEAFKKFFEHGVKV